MQKIASVFVFLYVFLLPLLRVSLVLFYSLSMQLFMVHSSNKTPSQQPICTPSAAQHDTGTAAHISICSGLTFRQSAGYYCTAPTGAWCRELKLFEQTGCWLDIWGSSCSVSGTVQVVIAVSRGTTGPAWVCVQGWSSNSVKDEATCTSMKFIVKPQESSGNCRYHQFKIEQFYVQPTQYIYVFCVDLRTNSDYFPIQH